MSSYLHTSWSISALLTVSVLVMATAAAAITMTTEVYAEPKANRTYYYFEWDYISPYTGEVVTGTQSSYNTAKECEENRVAHKEFDFIVRVSDSCEKIKVANPNNPK